MSGTENEKENQTERSECMTSGSRNDSMDQDYPETDQIASPIPSPAFFFDWPTTDFNAKHKRCKTYANPQDLVWDSSAATCFVPNDPIGQKRCETNTEPLNLWDASNVSIAPSTPFNDLNFGLENNGYPSFTPSPISSNELDPMWSNGNALGSSNETTSSRNSSPNDAGSWLGPRAQDEFVSPLWPNNTSNRNINKTKPLQSRCSPPNVAGSWLGPCAQNEFVAPMNIYNNWSGLKTNMGSSHFPPAASCDPLFVGLLPNVPDLAPILSPEQIALFARYKVAAGISSSLNPFPSLPSHAQGRKRCHTMPSMTNTATQNLLAALNIQSELMARSSSSNAKDDDDPTPRPQTIRSPADIYTAKWVRFKGTKREALCDLCPEPGKWCLPNNIRFQLKNSGYWYHKQFSHGISPHTKTYFAKPVEKRMAWTFKKSEDHGETFVNLCVAGLCGVCHNWILILNPKGRTILNKESVKSLKDSLVSENKSVILLHDPLVYSVSLNSKGKIHVPKGVFTITKKSQKRFQSRLLRNWIDV